MCAAGRQQHEQQCDVATKLVPLSLEKDGRGLLIAKLLKLLWRLDKTLNKAMWLSACQAVLR
jgi:hypothetical protein